MSCRVGRGEPATDPPRHNPADDNLKGKDRIVPGLQELFGHETLPGKVVR